MPARRTHEKAVRGKSDPLARRHERHIAGGQECVDLIFILTLDINYLPASCFLAQPLEINAPGLLAELDAQDFFGVILAIHLLPPPQTHNVRIDGGVTLGCLAVERAELGNGVACWRGRSLYLERRARRL